MLLTDDLQGIRIVENVHWTWQASGMDRSDTVKVRHPDYGEETAQIGGLGLEAVVEILAGEDV